MLRAFGKFKTKVESDNKEKAPQKERSARKQSHLAKRSQKERRSKTSRTNDEFRKRAIYGQVDFDLKIEMLDQRFRVPIKVVYEYAPQWPVFNVGSGREMPAVQFPFYLLRVNMMTPANTAGPTRGPQENAQIDIARIFWDYDLISTDARDKIFELVNMDARRQDTEARAEFARGESRASTTVRPDVVGKYGAWACL